RLNNEKARKRLELRLLENRGKAFSKLRTGSQARERLEPEASIKTEERTLITTLLRSASPAAPGCALRPRPRAGGRGSTPRADCSARAVRRGRWTEASRRRPPPRT